MPNTRLTSFECVYSMINNSAMEEATFSSSTAGSESDLSKLTDISDRYSYMFVPEHNYSVLSGTYSEFPNTFETPYISEEQSDENGDFEVNPQFSVSFTQPQSSYGLTFYFEENYPIEINIIVHRQNTSTTYVVNPTSLTYIADIEILNCVGMDIEFTKAMPYRFIKVRGIAFGQTVTWGENEIYSGKLLLEKDPIADKLSINTLNFEIIDKTNEYNIANDAGLHNYFQKRQYAYAYEYINDVPIFLGKYYLDTFSWDERLVKLNCVSAIGILEDTQFNSGRLYSGETAGNILDEIFTTAGVDYTADEETSNTLLYGTIKPMSCRDALREVLFACNSEITTVGDVVSISKSSTYILDSITRANKIKTTIIKNDYIYGVDVEYSTFTLKSEPENIVESELYLAGENILTFTSPYTNVTIKDGNNNTITPTVLQPYYCSFTLAHDTVITITGTSYEEKTNTVQAHREYLEPGESETIKKYKTSLCNAAMAKARAEEILAYWENRLTLNVQVIANDINMRGRRRVENPSKEYSDFIAWYTSRNFDLTGSFLDTAKLVGFYYYETATYYTGSELYSGEDIGLI